MTAEPTTLIHGDAWKLADIAEEVKWVRLQQWQWSKWQATPALVQKSGTRTQYRGQKFNPKYYNVVPDGWNHDHCQICWWALFGSEDLERNSGYSDGKHHWLCRECYEKFVASSEVKF